MNREDMSESHMAELGDKAMTRPTKERLEAPIENNVGHAVSQAKEPQ